MCHAFHSHDPVLFVFATQSLILLHKIQLHSRRVSVQVLASARKFRHGEHAVLSVLSSPACTQAKRQHLSGTLMCCTLARQLFAQNTACFAELYRRSLLHTLRPPGILPPASHITHTNQQRTAHTLAATQHSNCFHIHVAHNAWVCRLPCNQPKALCATALTKSGFVAGML